MIVILEEINWGGDFFQNPEGLTLGNKTLWTTFD